MDVDEDRRDVAVVVVGATRLLALSPMDLRASRHEEEDLLPPPLFKTMLLLALLLLLLLLIP